MPGASTAARAGPPPENARAPRRWGEARRMKGPLRPSGGTGAAHPCRRAQTRLDTPRFLSFLAFLGVPGPPLSEPEQPRRRVRRRRQPVTDVTQGERSWPCTTLPPGLGLPQCSDACRRAPAASRDAGRSPPQGGPQRSARSAGAATPAGQGCRAFFAGTAGEGWPPSGPHAGSAGRRAPGMAIARRNSPTRDGAARRGGRRLTPQYRRETGS